MRLSSCILYMPCEAYTRRYSVLNVCSALLLYRKYTVVRVLLRIECFSRTCRRQ